MTIETAAPLSDSSVEQNTFVSKGYEAWVAWPMTPILIAYVLAILWSIFSAISVWIAPSSCEKLAVAANRIAWMRDAHVPEDVTRLILLSTPFAVDIKPVVTVVYESPLLTQMTPSAIENSASTLCAIRNVFTQER
jgi:hypothetical protein